MPASPEHEALLSVDVQPHVTARLLPDCTPVTRALRVAGWLVADMLLCVVLRVTITLLCWASAFPAAKPGSEIQTRAERIL